MLRLASVQLAECLGRLRLKGIRPPLMLALPETKTTLPLDGGAFLAGLAQQMQGQPLCRARADAGQPLELINQSGQGAGEAAQGAANS